MNWTKLFLQGLGTTALAVSITPNVTEACEQDHQVQYPQGEACVCYVGTPDGVVYCSPGNNVGDPCLTSVQCTTNPGHGTGCGWFGCFS